jgi:hypothetical protein
MSTSARLALARLVHNVARLSGAAYRAMHHVLHRGCRGTGPRMVVS